MKTGKGLGRRKDRAESSDWWKGGTNSKRLEGRWSSGHFQEERSHFSNLLLLSVTLYAIFGVLKKRLMGNENVSICSLGRGDPLQAAAEKWHLGWAAVVLGTLHAWNSSWVRAQQPGLPS